jgi:hypothetical protein
MKIELKVTKEYDVRFLQVDAGVRYWEDGIINGENFEDGSTTPCVEGDRWKPLIDIESGKILNWNIGNTADIHYKVCDDGVYILLDENKDIILSYEGYVRNIMCPQEQGYGDYIIMSIDENGMIQEWNVDLTDFC